MRIVHCGRLIRRFDCNHKPSTPLSKMWSEKLRTMAKVRTVLVKVSPAPSTLSERRAILGVLKQHGDVEFFKRLQVRFCPHALSPASSC